MFGLIQTLWVKSTSLILCEVNLNTVVGEGNLTSIVGEVNLTTKLLYLIHYE